MCHPELAKFFAPPPAPQVLQQSVTTLCFGAANALRKIAILPDIYGDTPFYRQLAAHLGQGRARVYLVNPWQAYGELPEQTREAAYARRQKLKDGEFCRRLYRFVSEEGIDTVAGFCIGGNFLLELNRLGFAGTSLSVYPLPWGMPNQDALAPGFDFMAELQMPITIIMGKEDAHAGPENISLLERICRDNSQLELHLYEKSGHGFLRDLGSEDEFLRNNAQDALKLLNRKMFPDSAAVT